MKKPQIPDDPTPDEQPGQDDSTRGIIEGERGIIEDGKEAPADIVPNDTPPIFGGWPGRPFDN